MELNPSKRQLRTEMLLCVWIKKIIRPGWGHVPLFTLEEYKRVRKIIDV